MQNALHLLTCAGRLTIDGQGGRQAWLALEQCGIAGIEGGALLCGK